jgi:hypothetical protein
MSKKSPSSSEVDWVEVDVYSTWLIIGWDPYEYHEFNDGHTGMWTMHNETSGGWTNFSRHVTNFSRHVTPFNGESPAFNEVHEGNTKERRS